MTRPVSAIMLSRFKPGLEDQQPSHIWFGGGPAGPRALGRVDEREKPEAYCMASLLCCNVDSRQPAHTTMANALCSMASADVRDASFLISLSE